MIYELVEYKQIWENGQPKLVEVDVLQSGINAIIMTLRNKYGIKITKKLALGRGAINYIADHYVTVRKIPKYKFESMKRFKLIMEKCEKLLAKYRKAYDKALLNNDRVAGAIIETYCRKLDREVNYWTVMWSGALR